MKLTTTVKAAVCVLLCTSAGFLGCSFERRINPVPAPEAKPASQPKGAAKVSYYGDEFAGKKTASGERFNPQEYTAAHRSLPFGTRVKLKNPENGREVIVRINDRGPFVKGREFDISEAAARELGLTQDGVAKLRHEVISRGEG